MTLDKRRAKFAELMEPVLSDIGINELIRRGFLTAPASTKYHGNYEGGLFDHSLEVTEQLVKLTACNGLQWSRPTSPLIIGMFHDLCKIDSYIPQNDLEKGKWTYNSDQPLKGHGDKSIMLLSEFTTLTEEEIFCIRYHMGAFTDKEEWKDCTRAIHKYENVLWTHHADMLASHVMNV